MLAVLERKERVVEAEINILEYQEANRELWSCVCAVVCSFVWLSAHVSESWEI
jgi:hypothetical protein